MSGEPRKQFYFFVVGIPPIMLARFIEWLTHDAAGFFTFILFLVGIVQAGLFVWQLRLIRKSLRPAEEAARAATANARAMIENERPWIGVDTVWSEKLEPGVIIQKAYVRIKNTGKTPALRMRATFKGSVLPKSAAPTAPQVSSEAPKPLFPNVLDFYHPFGSFVLSDADFQEIIAGTRAAWIVGRIEYFDGSNRPHQTLVCCRWDQGRGVFIPHEQGNEADYCGRSVEWPLAFARCAVAMESGREPSSDHSKLFE